MKKSGPRGKLKRMARGQPFVKDNPIRELAAFRKGSSGHTLDGPIYTEISRALQAFLTLDESVPIRPRTHAEMIALAWLREAEKGNLRAITTLIERAEGRPRQANEFAGNDKLSELLEEMKAASKRLGPPQGEDELTVH